MIFKEHSALHMDINKQHHKPNAVTESTTTVCYHFKCHIHSPKG